LDPQAIFFARSEGVRLGDELILDCYRLAEHYHQPPEHFLNMTLSVLQTHRHYTAELIRQRQAAQRRPDEE
jgi:hypothetical protein